MKNKRKLHLYIAMSLDGYIAKPNDDLSFLSIVEKKNEDYGYAEFISSIDTIIMGRKTYDWVTSQCDYPHKDKITYVISRNKKANSDTHVNYHDNVAELVSKLKNEMGKAIFCDGGAQIVNELLKAKLFDTLIISLIPILLGSGVRLFEDELPEQNLKLLSVESFTTGLTQLRYKVI